MRIQRQISRTDYARVAESHAVIQLRVKVVILATAITAAILCYSNVSLMTVSLFVFFIFLLSCIFTKLQIDNFFNFFSISQYV